MNENFRFGQSVRDLKTGTRGIVLQACSNGDVTYMTMDACDVTVPRDMVVIV